VDTDVAIDEVRNKIPKPSLELEYTRVNQILKDKHVCTSKEEMYYNQGERIDTEHGCG